jgi:hypothetical protein
VEDHERGVVGVLERAPQIPGGGGRRRGVEGVPVYVMHRALHIGRGRLIKGPQTMFPVDDIALSAATWAGYR